MKKLLSGILVVLLAVVTVKVNALTTHKYNDWVTEGGYGTVEKVTDNIVKMNKDDKSTTGPYSKASTAKLKDGITEETYVEIKSSEFDLSELFEVSLALKNGNGEYVTEAVVMTQKVAEDKFKLSAGWAPKFEAYLEEDGIYTYQWKMFEENGQAYVIFTILNKDKVVATTGKISLDDEAITTNDTKNPVASQTDVSVKYLWFCNIQVKKGIKVYSKLPGLSVDSKIVSDNLTVQDSNFADILKDSLSSNYPELEKLLETENASVVLENTKIEADSETVKAFESVIENSKVASYFDISILVKTSEKSYPISELTDKIELSVSLPKMPALAEGYNRVYYILRSHDGKVEKLDTKVSEDGKSLIFTSDKFSTYAIAYVDNKIESATTTTTTKAKSSNPKTLDNISAYIALGLVSLTVVSCVGYKVIKKVNN